MKWLCLSWLLLYSLQAVPMPLQGDDSDNIVRIDVESIGDRTYGIYAVNNYPVILSTFIAAKGVALNKSAVAILKPKERKKILDFQVGDARSEVNITKQIAFGSIHARNSYIYRIPFESGVKAKVTQSFGDNRKSTHYDIKNPDKEYAVDFAADMGTSVVASRSGVVVAVRFDDTESCNEISCRDKGNFVLIAHSDGTLAQYAHFMPSEPLVQVHQQVKAGQVIGYVGSTGFSNGPHLHFDVSRPVWDGKEFIARLIPIEFTDGNRVLKPKTGVTYSFISKGRLISEINEK